MNSVAKISLGIALGAVLGASAVALWNPSSDPALGALDSKSDEPLYWVAPMNPDYKRDKPGKSPMGMDLIPVYAGDAASDSPGTVSIDPDVINNLGVRTVSARRGDMQNTVSTVGYVQYDEDRLVHIHPRVEGWIEKLHVKASGDPVTRDQPLYELYSPTLVNAQEELILALKRENPTLIQAALDRLAALQVSAEEIEELRRSRQVSQIVAVKAPQSGVVDELEVREGMFIRPGMNVMGIGNLAHVWITGEVFERQVALIREGDPVSVTLGYQPGREWQGEVDYIYPTLDASTRTAQIRVHIANTDSYLKPGMFAQLRIETTPKKDVVLIPREALIRTGAQARVVLALGAGRFKSVAVEVGRINFDEAEVISGIKPGDRVVASAQFLIDSESSKTSDFRRMSHGDGDAMDHVMPEMDHGTHEGMDHTMREMDHSAHEGMDNAMPEMDHSAHDGMEHTMREMDHSAHQGMDNAMPEMDHSAHDGMDHTRADTINDDGTSRSTQTASKETLQ